MYCSGMVCKPFTHGFPRANIHELLAPDLLHQIIKGTFKDHLVTWVINYIQHWTGNDSKALMKVQHISLTDAVFFLPAIVGHIPDQMVRALSFFMEFCYLVCQLVLDTNDLASIDAAIANFHCDHDIFDNVRPDGYSLPRQHSLVHYTTLIQEFGAPNGLCSSITESKHIKAVKEPRRRSSHFEALGQMLVTNQRVDKLAAAHVDFQARGMLRTPLFRPPDPLPTIHEDNNDNDGGDIDEEVDSEVIIAKQAIPNVAWSPKAFGASIGVPHLPNLISRFLYEQEHLNKLNDPNMNLNLDDIPLSDCPQYSRKIRPVPSAIAIYYSSSDKSGICGMHRERIRAVSSWRGGPSHYDCVFVVHDPDEPGFCGLHVARVHSFFSIQQHKLHYPCALVSWFSKIGNNPCSTTGMWIVEPDFDVTRSRAMSVISIDSIYQGAHLIGNAGRHYIPRTLTFNRSLDAFQSFYVNKYIDHHAHEIAF
ncbi:hypothetical protein CPB83DRAFT_937299 [Crepidotus variabilis]|uniref:Uncharacterized protein n=1 Tax=Crepidotus variabilis TaxID=179855 RepID=A0A9P6EC45_9AGAR|nr:hypothetical protein CPB83DRAFT_937299 [Crepidotus variabilis]